MIDLEAFKERLEKFHNDVRTEVLVAELFSQGLHTNDLTILHGGQHNRSFRRDLDKTSIEIQKNDQENIIFKLNRDSIYDSLPEGLFHQAQTPKNGISVKGMMDSYRRRKQEEKEARSFFAPFESEFFLQKAFVELKEKDFLEKISRNNFDEYFLKFFNIPSDLPSHLLSKFTALLPYCEKIVGNLSLTFKALETVLEETVRYKLKNAPLRNIIDTPSLADINLGVDFILGDSFYSDESVIEVTIGPIKKERIMAYIKNGPEVKFIETFFNFFLPANAEIETIFEVTQDTEFFLGDADEDSRLGYTSKLNISDEVYTS